MVSPEQKQQIRTKECPCCHICGTEGKLLYQGLSDRLFGVAGKWNLKKCMNADCGLLWLDPMPAKNDLSKLYVNYYTHQDLPSNFFSLSKLYQHIAKSYLSYNYGYYDDEKSLTKNISGQLMYLHPGRRASLDVSVMFLPAKPIGRLLEVGFGSGETLMFLQNIGWEVEGVDFDVVAVENARAKGLKVNHGELTDYNYPHATFDVVISSNVIEHVPDPVGFIQECYRILKVGGRLVLLTPNADALGHRIYKSDWRGLEPPRHLHVFTHSALLRACREVKFTNISCRLTGRGGGTLVDSYMLRRYGKIDNAASSFKKKLCREVMHFIEWIVCKLNRHAGEELLLIADKAID